MMRVRVILLRADLATLTTCDRREDSYFVPVSNGSVGIDKLVIDSESDRALHSRKGRMHS